MKFSVELLTRSAIASRHNILEQFNPAQDVIENGKVLHAMILSKIPFDYFIESFYRCKRLNLKVGGSRNSDHVLGRAADLDSKSLSNNKAIFDWINKHCEYDQLIWEFGSNKGPDWVHVSYRKNNNRNQALRAYKLNGRTAYKAI